MSKFQVLNAFLPTGVIGPLREVARVWKSLSGLKTKMKEIVVLLKRPRSLWTCKTFAMDQQKRNVLCSSFLSPTPKKKLNLECLAHLVARHNLGLSL